MQAEADRQEIFNLVQAAKTEAKPQEAAALQVQQRIPLRLAPMEMQLQKAQVNAVMGAGAQDLRPETLTRQTVGKAAILEAGAAVEAGRIQDIQQATAAQGLTVK